MNQTKETLEGLKSLFKGNKVEYSTAEEYQKEQATLSTAISWGEALERAEGELPKERELSHIEDRIKEIEEKGKPYSIEMVSWRMMLIEDKAINQVIDIARPILAKYLLRIEELKETIKDKDHFADDLIETAADFEKKLQAAKDKIEELEEEKYSSEFKIIDGLNQHPKGLTFEQWKKDEKKTN